LGGLALGFWEGGETRLRKTDWQAVDATVFSAVSTTIMKRVFTRERPSETDDPSRFFQGDSHDSFPSGEVAAMSAIVTPFVLEYHHESPSVYALELLPLYDAVARVKAQGHWQSDVIVGFGVGTLAGYYAHNREQPFFLELLPHGVAIGLRNRMASSSTRWPVANLQITRSRKTIIPSAHTKVQANQRRVVSSQCLEPRNPTTRDQRACP
jgi:hypothetical protein